MGLVISSCQSELDPEVWNQYVQISQAQDWLTEQVLHRGMDRIKKQVEEKGRLPKDVEMLRSIENELQAYYEVNNLISNSIEKRLNYNGELLELMVDDSVAKAFDQKAKTWMFERVLNTKLNAGPHPTDWLVYELKFREMGLNYLQEKLSSAYAELQNPKMAYMDSTELIREVFYVYDKIEISGVPQKLDSTGVFSIPQARPVTITVPKEQDIYRLVVVEDTEFILN